MICDLNFSLFLFTSRISLITSREMKIFTFLMSQRTTRPRKINNSDSLHSVVFTADLHTSIVFLRSLFSRFSARLERFYDANRSLDSRLAVYFHLKQTFTIESSDWSGCVLLSIPPLIMLQKRAKRSHYENLQTTTTCGSERVTHMEGARERNMEIVFRRKKNSSHSLSLARLNPQ